ncbi:MAG: M20/M25/M40 family metallo-hydrolase [Caulobacterales bacterium]|nr:M20/M25/M40 family metallo-hydrolase [Caulobacterales bacterium]
MMTRFAAAALAAGLHAGVALAQESFEIPADVRAVAEGLIAAALEDDRGYDIVESLTTEVGPRLAGTPEEARARAWALETLNELGFANVREEPFEIDAWTRGRETAHVTAPFPQELLVTALGGSVATPADGLEAEVALLDDYDQLLATPEGALEGKIAFINGRMAANQDGSGYGLANRKRVTGAIEAARRGAAAVLIRSVGTDSQRFPHTGQMSGYDLSVTPIPAAALSVTDADQLERIIARGGPTTVKLVLTPRVLDAQPSGNVVAEVVGRELPDEIVLIGAHLDSWDLGTGALDDGAGVGIVTAAAKLIAELPEPPRRTIRVVYFGSEEVGLLGARAYVERHADLLDLHVLGAESDFGARRVWRFDSGVGESARAKTDAIAALLRPLGVGRGVDDTTGGPDMGPLHARGVPVLDLVQNGIDYFHFHHTADDTVDKIDPAELRQNVAVYAAVAYLAAELPGGFRDVSAPN